MGLWTRKKRSIKSVERLIIHPHETLVITVPGASYDEEAMQYVADEIKKYLPKGVNVLLKDTGVELFVVAGKDDTHG